MNNVVTQTVVVPEPDADSAAFWEALKEGRLEVPRCGSCDRRSFPPMPSCPFCGSTDVSLAPVSGRGSVYSWVTVHVALDPAFEDIVPYTIVTVELDEDPGARLVGRLVDREGNALVDPGDALAAGATVEFVPLHVVDDVVLPGFVLSATSGGAA
jgi:uncharacterized protein